VWKHQRVACWNVWQRVLIQPPEGPTGLLAALMLSPEEAARWLSSPVHWPAHALEH
jgi:hypothetical protein